MTEKMAIPDSSATRFISPAQHAVLDYGVAATFFMMGARYAGRHRAAAGLAFLNGALVLGMSLLTDYPGGVYRTLSFKGHRTGDILQAGLAGLGPILLGFSGDAEATYFYGQALSEVAVITATDWDGTGAQRASESFDETPF
jgi:hypothetical protein